MFLLDTTYFVFLAIITYIKSRNTLRKEWLWYCMHRASSCNMYINQQDAQNSCDWTLFSIYTLHVSDCISPSSVAIFLCAVCCIWYMRVRLAVVLLSAYTKYDIQHIKRLLLKMDWYSPKHVERILKIKSNHKNFVHLVGLYTYWRNDFETTFSDRKGLYSLKWKRAFIKKNFLLPICLFLTLTISLSEIRAFVL